MILHYVVIIGRWGDVYVVCILTEPDIHIVYSLWMNVVSEFVPCNILQLQSESPNEKQQQEKSNEFGRPLSQKQQSRIIYFMSNELGHIWRFYFSFWIRT